MICTSASDSERSRSVPTVNSPSRRTRRWLAKLIRSQTASSSSAAWLGVDVARDPQQQLALAALERGPSSVSSTSGARSGCGSVSRRMISASRCAGDRRGAGRKLDDDVGVRLLGPDERLGVALAVVELPQDLVGRVAAARAVALELPRPAQLLGRGEEHAHVVRDAQRLGVEAQQPLDDEVVRGLQVLRAPERALAVVVDRLEHRLPAPQLPEVLGQDVEVVGVRVQRRDAELRRSRRS